MERGTARVKGDVCITSEYKDTYYKVRCAMSKPYRDYVGDLPLDPPDRGDDYTCYYCGDVVGYDDLVPGELDHPRCFKCEREMT